MSIGRLFLVSTFTVVVLWGCVVFLSRQPTDSALLQFLLLTTAMAVPTLLLLWRCNETKFTLPFWWILISAALLRLMSVAGDPLFEDDYFRYLWDGYQTVTTNDPYTKAPDTFFDQDVPEPFELILSFINYPGIATVYGPVSQWFFGLAYLIAPGEVWPLQLLSGLGDLIIICLISRLGAGNALLLYAWSPLILKEYSLTAHPDVFAVMFAVIGILAAFRRRALVAGFALGLALGAKIFALLIIPFLISSDWSIRFWFRFCTAIVICLTTITAWFGSFRIWVPEGLLAMAESWLFNSPLYYMLLPTLKFQTIKVILITSFTIYAMAVLYRRMRRDYIDHLEGEDPDPGKSLSSRNGTKTPWNQTKAAFRGDWLFALFLLSLPVINPWYVAWLLPFAALYPRWWSWTASFAILLSYWYGSNVGAIGADSLRLPTGVLLTEYLLIILAPVTVWLVRRYRRSV